MIQKAKLPGIAILQYQAFRASSWLSIAIMISVYHWTALSPKPHDCPLSIISGKAAKYHDFSSLALS